MKIGIDANWMINEKAGVGNYSFNIIKNLLEIDNHNEYFLYANLLKNSKERRKVIESLISENKSNRAHVRISRIPRKIGEVISGTFLPYKLIIKDDLDLYFSPYFLGIPKNGFTKMVVTIHDLVFVKFPEHLGKKNSAYSLKRTKIALQNCEKIIAVSESTKRDLINKLNVDSEKVEVIYEGVEKMYHEIKDIPKIKKVISKYGLDFQEYILSLCTLEPRKNLRRLLEAYSILTQNIKEKYKLVLAGGSGWNNADINESIIKLHLEKHIIRTGYILKIDLPYLYSGAKVFVYPSLYEGFGLPPLEAMACGLPVVTSKTSSLPEVVGKAAILIDPRNVEDIAGAILKIIRSSQLSESMKKKGLNQSRNFSWAKSARETLELFQKLA